MTLTEAISYRYQPLSSNRCFRAIVLLPSDERDDDVYCRLKEILLDHEYHSLRGQLDTNSRRMYKDPVHDSNLDHVKRKLQDGLKRYQDHPDTPKFEALSYAWKLNEEEETTPNKPGEAFVFCGNENTRKPLPVTINCKLALQYLRHPSETRVIFVDAICIDQNNLEERSQQVALMGEIYGKAENVLVWLGPATEDSDLAMHCIERFAVKMSGLDEDEVSKASGSFWNEESNRHGYRHGNEFQRLSFMWDPLDRTYFDRLWPLQETTCARSSEFICGERVVPWKSFQYTYAFLAKRYEMSDQILERYKRFLTHDCLRAVANLFTFMSQGPEQKAVSEYAGSIFTASASFSCGEPQDKVYAVYWILKDIFSNFPEPDYTRSLAEIYRDATVSIINSSRSVDFVAHKFGDSVDLPSWVLDWRGENVLKLKGRPEFIEKNASLNPNGNILPVFDTNLNTMSLFGAYPSNCSVCMESLPLDVKSLFASGPQIMKWLQKLHLATRDFNRYPSLLQVWDALEKAVIGFGIRMSTEEVQSRRTEVAGILDMVSHGESYDHSAVARLAIQLSLLGSGVFTTDDGRIAVTAQKVRKGDPIVLPCRGSLPLLVRPNYRTTTSWDLVGSAWVDGFMSEEPWPLNGELMKFILE